MQKWLLDLYFFSTKFKRIHYLKQASQDTFNFNKRTLTPHPFLHWVHKITQKFIPQNIMVQVYMLWFNFTLGLNFIPFVLGMVMYNEEFKTKGIKI